MAVLQRATRTVKTAARWRSRALGFCLLLFFFFLKSVLTGWPCKRLSWRIQYVHQMEVCKTTTKMRTHARTLTDNSEHLCAYREKTLRFIKTLSFLQILFKCPFRDWELGQWGRRGGHLCVYLLISSWSPVEHLEHGLKSWKKTWISSTGEKSFLLLFFLNHSQKI